MTETKKGRPAKVDPVRVVRWRQARKATIAETAKRFGISPATVKRYTRDHSEEAEQARANYRAEREIKEAEILDYNVKIAAAVQRRAKEADEDFQRDPSWANFFRALSWASRLVPREYLNKKPGDWSPPDF